MDANNTTNSTGDPFESAQSRKSIWIGLLWPALYLTILIGSLYAFSSLHRKRQLAKSTRLEPWFPPHRQRDIYLSLLHQEADGTDEKQAQRAPDSVLAAALLQRAFEDIKRIVQLRTSKQALQMLLQRGSVGEELWQRYQHAEQEMEAELKDVIEEDQANGIAPNWGNFIFQSANEMNQNRLLRERIEDAQRPLENERQWWANKKSGMAAELMRELDEDGNSSEAKKATTSDDDAVLVESGGPTQAQGSGKKKKGKK
ncbi:hypothetical protein K470DRAFT_265577 [Piedraia hortae CBS 480.64]|uniref:Translocation protein n=1 Tax=Piedraia hortae CBS 480.64 TaxID=1314780 RepID=A0A6A7BVA8_9PEZI|nr:hypothetical protein K470DRAFT_265577 [Piedraia hortae CBS 480.64]